MAFCGGNISLLRMFDMNSAKDVDYRIKKQTKNDDYALNFMRLRQKKIKLDLNQCQSIGITRSQTFFRQNRWRITQGDGRIRYDGPNIRKFCEEKQIDV